MKAGGSFNHHQKFKIELLSRPFAASTPHFSQKQEETAMKEGKGQNKKQVPKIKQKSS